jgi:transposase
MPWHTSDLVQQREELVKLADVGVEYFSRLCHSFGISRVTGYRWLRRYRLADKASAVLTDRNRGPHSSPNRVTPDVIELVLAQRAQSGWGARKLSVILGQAGVRIAPSTVNKILKEQGRIVSEGPNTASWIKQVFVADDPLSRITTDVPAASTPACFAERLRHGCLRDRKKAMAVLAGFKGIRLHTVAESLDLTPHTVIRYAVTFAGGGVVALFRATQSRVHDEEHQGPVFALLHSPPSSYGINRTTWRMEDLHNVLAQTGHRMSERRIRRIIKAGGFRWRKAKTVLTSNDPQYQPKLDAVKGVLSELKPDEAFFSIDEYGPFAVKKKGGRKRVGPGENYVVPQWQKSKGWMILTAALELSRNQVTHFYSLKKNTDEMIKMADLLRQQYRDCRSIHLSWDAASWHISRKLVAHLKGANREAVRDGYPFVWTALCLQAPNSSTLSSRYSVECPGQSFTTATMPRWALQRTPLTCTFAREMSISLDTRNEQGTGFGARSEFQANSRRPTTAKIPHIGRCRIPPGKTCPEGPTEDSKQRITNGDTVKFLQSIAKLFPHFPDRGERCCSPQKVPSNLTIGKAASSATLESN